MAYKVVWHEDALEDLSVLDKQISSRILSKVDTHLIKSPDTLGSQMKGEFSGFYKYRIGDWRVVFFLDDEDKLIKILKVGHRRNIYE